MNLKTVLAYLWKLPLCGIGFFIGIALSGIILPSLGFKSPEMPEGTDANTIMLWFLLGSILLAFTLSFLSRNMSANWLLRWGILFELIWIFGAFGVVLEAFFFMTTGAVSSMSNALFTLLNFLLPAIFLSALVAVLFQPIMAIEPCQHRLQIYAMFYKRSTWMWRIILVLLAYPVTYIVFGLLVQPFIKKFYIAGQYELTIPTWGQLIPLQLTRSVLLLLASAPIMVWWQSSPRKVWLALGSSIFILTAFMAVITAYWFPWQLRLFHGLELLADALVYTGVLVVCLSVTENRSEVEKAA